MSSFRGLIGFPGVNVWDSAFSYLLAVVKSSLLKVRGKIQIKTRSTTDTAVTFFTAASCSWAGVRDELQLVPGRPVSFMSRFR